MIRTDRNLDLSVGSMTLLISKIIDGHRQKLDSLIEIFVHIRCRCTFDVKALTLGIPSSKCLRASFVASMTPIYPLRFEALLNRFGV